MTILANWSPMPIMSSAISPKYPPCLSAIGLRRWLWERVEPDMFKIDAERDRQYIEEFRKHPIGGHSPGLQRLLNFMRNDTSGYQIVLVCRKPFAEWVLGTMPPSRFDGPIVIEKGPVFTSR